MYTNYLNNYVAAVLWMKTCKGQYRLSNTAGIHNSR